MKNPFRRTQVVVFDNGQMDEHRCSGECLCDFCWPQTLEKINHGLIQQSKACRKKSCKKNGCDCGY
jgi:hypothetical protein